MTEQQVAELLANDINSNFAWIQLGFTAVSCLLLIISIILAMRGYAAMSEARLLHRAAPDKAELRDKKRRALSVKINEASHRRKIRSGKRSLV